MNRSLFVGALVALTLAPPSAGEERRLTATEAIAAALGSNLAILEQQQQVAGNRGVYQAARGAFDPDLLLSVSGSRDSAPLTPSQEEQAGQPTDFQRSLSYAAGVSSLLRSGATVAGTFSASRTTDEFLQPIPLHTVSFDVSFRQPLARGRGRRVATAEEEAARHSLEASELTLRDTQAATAATAILNYWAYVAAADEAEVLRRAEEEQRSLLEVLRRLVAGDVIAAGDVPQAEAQLATRSLQLIDAEQTLEQARHDLAATMALPANEAAGLPLPADHLPVPAATPPDVEGLAAGLAAHALERRPDLRALRAQRQAVSLVSLAAADQLRPQLDLVLETAYVSLAEGGRRGVIFGGSGANRGPAVAATLSLQSPLVRDVARGNLVRARAADRELAVQLADGERVAPSDIRLSAVTLALRASEVSAARTAVTGYRTALDNARRRMQFGLATVVDVVLISDQVVQAEVQELRLRLSWVRELARLRYLSATLLPDQGGAATVPDTALVTWPMAPPPGAG